MTTRTRAPAHPITVAVVAASECGHVAHWGTIRAAADCGRRYTHHEPFDAEYGLLGWMEHRGVDQAWLWHGAPGVALLASAHDDGGWTHTPNPPGDAGPPWQIWYHQGVYGAREVAMPPGDGSSPWDAAESPLRLLQGLLLYSELVGAWRWSAGSTGTRLMREMYRDAPPCPGLPEVAGRGLIEGGIEWCRRLEPGEPAAYVHAYDRNGAYLAAAGACELGVGACVRWTPDAHPVPPLTAPGYWRPAGPLTSLPRAMAGPAGWITTPTLALLAEVGGVPLAEGWYWPRHARALYPWYERLRDARAALLARGDDSAARLALAALKQTYTHAIGWLGGRMHGEPDPDAPAATHRAVYGGAPDWRHAIHAMANANLVRAVRKLGAAGVDVLGVAELDTAYVLGDAADGHPAVPVGTGLGAWKLKATYDLRADPTGAGPGLESPDAHARVAALRAIICAMHAAGR